MNPDITKEEKEKAISYVASYLCSDYNYPIDLAMQITVRSPFILLLNEESEFVFHYNFEYWAQEIHEWYQRNNDIKNIIDA